MVALFVCLFSQAPLSNLFRAYSLGLVPYGSDLAVWQLLVGGALILTLGDSLATGGLTAVLARVLRRDKEWLHKSAVVCYIPRRTALKVIAFCSFAVQAYQMGLLSTFGHVGALLGSIGFQTMSSFDAAGTRVYFAVLAAVVVAGVVAYLLVYALWARRQQGPFIPYETVESGL